MHWWWVAVNMNAGVVQDRTVRCDGREWKAQMIWRRRCDVGSGERERVSILSPESGNRVFVLTSQAFAAGASQPFWSGAG